MGFIKPSFPARGRNNCLWPENIFKLIKHIYCLPPQRVYLNKCGVSCMRGVSDIGLKGSNGNRVNTDGGDSQHNCGRMRALACSGVVSFISLGLVLLIWLGRVTTNNGTTCTCDPTDFRDPLAWWTWHLTWRIMWSRIPGLNIYMCLVCSGPSET